MITIIDYNAGNIISVQRALNHLGLDNIITGDPETIVNAERIIFPGVGNAATAMEYLTQTGIGQALQQANKKGTPIMGICLGAQIIFAHSQEGDTQCLSLIDGDVIKFDTEQKQFKVPHMGWNSLHITEPHFVLKEIKPNDTFYFVHSYHIQTTPEFVNATCDYICDFPAVVSRENVVATQFHPEKSGEPGLSILRSFGAWEG